MPFDKQSMTIPLPQPRGGRKVFQPCPCGATMRHATCEEPRRHEQWQQQQSQQQQQ